MWGLKGNFLYVPTDCPQRDERLGWTGDIQVFAPTASFLYDVRGFLDSWLRDLALEQEHEDGVVPFVVPNVLGKARPAAAWGDAATVVPWVLNERYADTTVLERQYPSMKAWTDVLLEIAGDRRLWEGKFQFGDWLDPDAPPDLPGAGEDGWRHRRERLPLPLRRRRRPRRAPARERHRRDPLLATSSRPCRRRHDRDRHAHRPPLALRRRRLPS